MCGVVGIFGSPQASKLAYQALLVLQHRGQDGAGILSFDQKSHRVHIHKTHGLVSKVFNEEILQGLAGEVALGHTRYSTTAQKNKNLDQDLQPMVVNYPHGVGLIHNGNILNVPELSKLLSENFSRILLSQNDVEVLLNLISLHLDASRNLDPIKRLEIASTGIFNDVMGGYAIIGHFMNGYFFALRDPHGIRPLVLGRHKNDSEEISYVVASETVVLDFLGYEYVRDIEPGELIVIDKNRKIHSRILTSGNNKSPCMFEWIYFSTPESNFDGHSVYQVRLLLGKYLGQKIKKIKDDNNIEIDAVVPVPESGRIASIAISEELGIPFREYLIKNRYIQRSFILKDQKSRQEAISNKLMAVKSQIKGKNLLVVDDSIVRGATSKKIVALLKDAGAKSVIFVSTCPPIKSPCFFGIDFPQESELISAQLTQTELAEYLGADQVIFQDQESLDEIFGKNQYCQGCLTGVYPFALNGKDKIFENIRIQAEEEGRLCQLH